MYDSPTAVPTEESSHGEGRFLSLGYLSTLGTARAWLRSPYAFLDRALQRGELTFRLRLPVVGDSLVTGDPALVAEAAKNRDLIGGRGTEALRPVVGEHSLIAIEGDAHQRHRAALLPHFFHADPALHLRMMRKWTLEALDALAVGQEFAGSDFANRITLNAMIEVIFGALAPRDHERLVRHVEDWLGSFRHPAILFLKPLHLDLGRRFGWGRFLANRRDVHDFIRTHLARITAGECEGGVLGALLRARSAGEVALDDDEIVSEAVTFLLFGHDTSAQAMGWVFHHLWNDRDALTRAQAEVAACGGDWSAQALPFLRSALHESMRLCPVVVHLTRHAVANTRVGDHEIPVGSRVLPCLYLAHRNPAVFEQPQRYVADRFLAPRPEWRHAFFPFGLGNRLCAGMPLALQQMLAIAAALLERCTLQTVAPEQVRPVRKMVLIVPSGGPRLRRVA